MLNSKMMFQSTIRSPIRTTFIQDSILALMVKYSFWGNPKDCKNTLGISISGIGSGIVIPGRVGLGIGP